MSDDDRDPCQRGVGEDRAAITAWLDSDRSRRLVRWRNDPTAPLHWPVDGSAHSMAGLIRELVKRATDQEFQTLLILLTVRTLRLRTGEGVELHSSSDPYAVWQRMDRACPGDYGFAYLQDGPERWRVQVTRRQSAE